VAPRLFIAETKSLSVFWGPAQIRFGSKPEAAVAGTATPSVWRMSPRPSRLLAEYTKEVDRVATVDHSVEIESSYQAATGDNAAKSRWGAALLRKYMGHRDNPAGALPSEIQDPWGMVAVDPHWSQVQVYETPIPLWPTQLRPGWQTRMSTKYKTPANQDGLPWDQTMKAHAWETISVPAGQFRVLRYTNMIQFRSGDFARTDSVRRETLWFAPEVGRWVARESTGSYYLDDSVVDQPYNESGFRWELLEWS